MRAHIAGAPRARVTPGMRPGAMMMTTMPMRGGGGGGGVAGTFARGDDDDGGGVGAGTRRRDVRRHDSARGREGAPRRHIIAKARREDDAGEGEGEDADEDGFRSYRGAFDASEEDEDEDIGAFGVRGGDGASSTDGALDAWMREADWDDTSVGLGGGSGARSDASAGATWDSMSGSVPPDDIISESSQHWFDNSDEWYEPTYKEVNAREGSVLEKVQRMHLNEPSDFSFKDGEYFDLMGYVKEKTDNEFCLVLEVAERARERKIERLESLNPPRQDRLGPIQQAIADLALEVEMSGGKTSAYLAMREAADRARLRYELQQASWCWDKYCEDSMRSMGVSEKAEQMLHMGERQNEAMDFERDLLQEDS